MREADTSLRDFQGRKIVPGDAVVYLVDSLHGLCLRRGTVLDVQEGRIIVEVDKRGRRGHRKVHLTLPERIHVCLAQDRQD